jgi:hypothetical protein
MDHLMKTATKDKGFTWNMFAVNLGAGDGVAMIPGVSCQAGFDCKNQWSDPVYPLYAQRGFHGLCVEGNPSYMPLLQQNLPQPDISKVTAMINPSNVVKLLQDGKTPLDLDYWKNDIDSYDCAVHLAVLDHGYRPKVIQVEVNPDVPDPIAFGVLFSDKFKPNLGAAGFYGCSLALSSAIIKPFGYVLADVGLRSHDAIYVRSDVAKAAGVPDLPDAKGSEKLATCCLTGHWGYLGSYQFWAPMPVPERQQAVLQAAQQGCVLSQLTATCEIPFSVDATHFLATARAVPGAIPAR